MPKFASEKMVKKLTRRDGKTEFVDELSTVEVNFAKPFVKVPKVFVNLDGDSNFQVTNKTKTGFKIKFKDSSFISADYTGEFDWEAVPDEAFE